MAWYAVRVVYEHDEALFGERVVLLEAANTDELLDKAEKDWAAQVALNPTFKKLGDFTAFTVSESGPPTNGTEIWCMLYEAEMPGKDFLEQRYERFQLRSDETGV